MYNLTKGFLDVEGKSSYKINFNGESYIVGDQGEEKSLDTSKTNILHKLCAYTAICHFLEPESIENEIYLSLACPISVLKITEAKEEYKSFIKGDGIIEVTINDKNYSFEVKEITLKAESSGIVYLEPELFKNSNVGICDIGGLNFSLSIYRNGSCTNAERFCEEYGANELTELVRSELSKYKNGNIISYESAENALNKGYLIKFGQPDKESITYINAAKEQLLTKAFNSFASQKVDIESLDSIVFVGGTTQKLIDQINDRFPNAYIPENSQWSTVDGLYTIAYNKYALPMLKK